MVKVRYSDLKTPAWQRAVIWVIAIALLGGTLVGLFFMVFAAKNPSVDPGAIAQEKAIKNYQKQYEEQIKIQQEQLKAQQKNYEALPGYEKYVAKFDANSIKNLKVKVLKEGEGATISEDSTIKANYTGWTPNGKIFDTTKYKNSDAQSAEFSLKQVIAGWTEGLKNRRVGGIYLLEIPAAKAYGESGSAPFIDPNTPLKFLVQIIDLIK